MSEYGTFSTQALQKLLVHGNRDSKEQAEIVAELDRRMNVYRRADTGTLSLFPETPSQKPEVRRRKSTGEA